MLYKLQNGLLKKKQSKDIISLPDIKVKHVTRVACFTFYTN